MYATQLSYYINVKQAITSLIFFVDFMARKEPQL